MYCPSPGADLMSSNRAAVDTSVVPFRPSPADAGHGRDVTAHHEAARAVVLYRTAGFVCGEVTIVPNPEKGISGYARDACGDSLNQNHRRAHILSCYAGAHADRHLGFVRGFQCDHEDALAAKQEAALREQSRALVEAHWAEIAAVAEELLRVDTLDDLEVEFIADVAAGSRDVTIADLGHYRALRDASRFPRWSQTQAADFKRTAT